MIKLDLKAESPELEVLKTYLEENASEILASKINNGVRIEKDGKTLINKKTLETFMNYAQGEAQKLAAKGARYACIKSDIVFGWAIHYFEEDSLEGTLYNEDGTPYKSAPKAASKPVKPAPATVVAKPAKAEPKQFTLFDLVSDAPAKEDPLPVEEVVVEEEIPATLDNYNIDEETGEILSLKTVEDKQGSSFYQEYLSYKKKYCYDIIAFRLGDFYEILGKDAVEIADKLDLTLTSRDCGLEERVPMIGFPYHVADNYFFKIINYRALVIVDNGKVSFMPQIDDEIDEELSEEEMQEFDGDIDEEIPVETDIDNNDDDELNDIEYMKYIDKDAFMFLVEFLDDKLDVQ
jgi:hypothetical protein